MVTYEEYLKLKEMYSQANRPGADYHGAGFNAFEAGVVVPTPGGYADPYIAFTESPLGKFLRGASDILRANPISQAMAALFTGVEGFVGKAIQVVKVAGLVIVIGASGYVVLKVISIARPRVIK